MPSYTMKDPDGIEHEIFCSISEMEEKKEQGWTNVFTFVRHGIIRHTGDVISHTPDTFKDRLREIKHKHPGSTIEI